MKPAEHLGARPTATWGTSGTSITSVNSERDLAAGTNRDFTRVVLTSRTANQPTASTQFSATANPRAPRDRYALRRFLIEDNREITRDGKTRCPAPGHEDRTPSAHVYDGDEGGHLHCFACGYHLDAFRYLSEVRHFSHREALALLEPDRPNPALARRRPPPSPQGRGLRSAVPECITTPLPVGAVRVHRGRAEGLRAVPAALEGRGFTVPDLQELGIASESGRAIIPILGPDGQVLRLKMRRAPHESGPRYRYIDAVGEGTPAWCSPNWGSAGLTLVMEGELNAAICWCVRPDLDVVGVAGANGSLPLARLAGRSVVVYADGDRIGQSALMRWAQALHHYGCAVSVLPAWDRDACDVAGQLGRTELGRRLA